MIYPVSEQVTQYTLWKRAIDRSIGWNNEDDDDVDDDDFPEF